MDELLLRERTRPRINIASQTSKNSFATLSAVDLPLAANSTVKPSGAAASDAWHFRLKMTLTGINFNSQV
jgi:hypothetical protein